MAEPQDLLEEARRAGVVESAGRFTLDYHTAIAKLRGFQVQNQHHYVNRLLRAAHIDGASEVHLQADASKTRVFFPAAVCQPAELGQLFEQIFQNHRPAVRELATATNLALALKPKRLEVRISNAENGKVLHIQGGHVELYDTGPGLPGTTFQLTRSLGSAMRNWGGLSAECLAISRRFRFTPLSIRLNGEQLDTKSWWGAPEAGSDDRLLLRADSGSQGKFVPARHHVAELRVFHGRDSLNSIGLGPSRASSLAGLNPCHLNQEGRSRCFVAIGLCADEKRTSVAHFIHRGETLQSFPAKLPLPGTEVLIACDDLNLDISGEKLDQDDAFQTRWTLVKELVASFSDALTQAYSQRPRALAALDTHGTWTSRLYIRPDLLRALDT